MTGNITFQTQIKDDAKIWIPKTKRETGEKVQLVTRVCEQYSSNEQLYVFLPGFLEI